ncbi:MAG: hypothetical protein HKM93_21380 [Desulfobacteraceae bacterium]|nr:hypothetical protein [Desulfobacteraceae bacterium]
MGKKENTLDSVRAPRPSDYMPAAIQQAVVGKGLKHPMTIYPLALGISSGIVGWLFSVPALYMATLAGGVLGPLWAVIQVFFRAEKHGGRYIHELNQRQKQYEKYLRVRISGDFKEIRKNPDMAAFADQAIRQLGSIEVKYANVKELLELKLKRGELTYGRFLGAAEQVTLSVLDNLKHVASTLKSAGSIRPDYVREGLAKIDAVAQPSEEQLAQRQTLQERLDLWEAQLKKSGALLAANESAMTELEKISAAVADWQTDGKFADTGFESAIARLHELAEQAHEYN